MIVGSVVQCLDHPFTVLLHSGDRTNLSLKLLLSISTLAVILLLTAKTFIINFYTSRSRSFCLLSLLCLFSLLSLLCLHSLLSLRTWNKSFLSSSSRRSVKPEGALPSLGDLPDAGRGEVVGGEEAAGGEVLAVGRAVTG